MNALETRGLTKYCGRQRGIIDVALAVAEGEIFGFVGPNGAGKSTTIRTLMGLVSPTWGEARMLGRDAPFGDPEVGRKVGYLPSGVARDDHMSARELLPYSARFFGAGQVNGRLSELAERFGLDLQRDIAALSSGNRKKVAIARDGRVIEIAEIDALRRRHLSRARVTFPDPVRAEELGIAGQLTVQPDGRSVQIMCAGEPDALIVAFELFTVAIVPSVIGGSAARMTALLEISPDALRKAFGFDLVA